MKRWFLLLGLAGCSITLSGPDPNRPRNRMPECDTGKGLVALDTGLAMVSGLAAIGVAAGSGSAALIPAVIGAAFVGGALHGNAVVDACRAANAEYVAGFQQTPRRPIVADEADVPVQPMVRLPPQAPLPPQQRVPQPPPVAPQPAVQPPPQPQPQPQAPWAEFWKEVR